MIKILQLPLGPIQTNCYIVGCEETGKAAVIDPSWEGRAIAATATEQGLEITHILLTHAHFDHIAGLAQLKTEIQMPTYAHPDTIPELGVAVQRAQAWGFDILPPPMPDHPLAEGDIIEIGNLKLEVLYMPGHAVGHVGFYIREHNVIFDGDVLFKQGIGRTDLPGGDYATLMKSIHEKLLTLPDETHVLSGHGPATTIGDEKRFNPFLQR